MSSSTPDPKQDPQARVFLENLEKNGQLVEVSENDDTSKLPAKVTHVRYPDGTVKRIRFTGAAQR